MQLPIPTLTVKEIAEKTEKRDELPLQTRMALVILVMIYVIAMAWKSFQKFDSFGYLGYDLGIFTQATWLISQGKSPFVSIRGVHLLGDHFSLILYLIAPIFKLFPHARTLLLLQSAARGVGAFPVFGLARLKTGSSRLGLLFALLYLVFPAVQGVDLAEFHPDTFAVPAILCAMLCFERKSWRLYFLSLAIALMTKETIGILVVVWGATLLRRHRNIGLATIGTGLAGAVIANLTIRLCNHGEPTPYLWVYHNLGATLPEILKNALTNPQLTSSVLNTPENREVGLQLLLPLAFLPLMQPLKSLPALPALLSVLLSSRSWMHNINQWSLCPAIPFLFDASVSAFQQLRKELPEKNVRVYETSLQCCLLAMCAIGFVNDPLLHPTPLFFKTRSELSSVESVLSKIPKGASVSASTMFLPRLATRKRVSCFAYPFYPAGWGGGLLTLQQHDGVNLFEMSESEVAAKIESSEVDYLLISFGHPSIAPPATYLRILRQLLTSKKYEIVEFKRECVLLHSGGVSERNLEKSENYFRKQLRTEKELESALQEWMGEGVSE